MKSKLSLQLSPGLVSALLCSCSSSLCFCGLFESTTSRVQSNNTMLPRRVQYPSCGCVETQEPFLRAERGYSNWGLVTQNIRSKGQRMVVASQAGMHSSGLSWCLCWKVGADES